MRFLSQRYNWGDVAKTRGVLWEAQGSGVRDQGSELKPQNSKLKPQTSKLTIAVAEALASMGATEDDAALLRGATRAISEIEDARG